jgi:hypothetical protein
MKFLSLALVTSIEFAVVVGLMCSCQTGGAGSTGVSGNDTGSGPVNENEAHEYQKAVNRCHRTGGTRVVKIMGELKCY